MSKAITRFKGEYGWLSNFFTVPITYNNQSYASVEHAYQAAKTTSASARQHIRNAPTLGIAKKRGKEAPIRPDWHQIKRAVMLDLLVQKFTRYPGPRDKLIATGNAQLIEGNNWNDSHWGCIVVNGQWCGQNVLGKLLMDIRADLIAQQQQPAQLQRAA